MSFPQARLPPLLPRPPWTVCRDPDYRVGLFPPHAPKGDIWDILEDVIVVGQLSSLTLAHLP